MKKFLIYLSLGFIPLIVGCGGSELQGEPVALPIPFSGTLTSDSNILIADGDPLTGTGASLNAVLKTQTSDSPITWEFFDGKLLDSCGTVTISSMSEPINVTPLSGGGEQREYNLDTTLRGSDVAFEIRSNLQCFENPTPYSPTQDTLDLAATIPDATADVRKLACSGPIDCVCPGGGTDCDRSGCVEDQDLNLNVVTDVIRHADGTTTFNTQRESNLIFDGPSGSGGSFCAGDESQVKGKVLMTLILQGFPAYLSRNPPDEIPGPSPVPVEIREPPAGPLESVVAIPLYVPGINEIQGTFIHHSHFSTFTLSDDGGVEQFDTDATSDIYVYDIDGIHDSYLRVHTVYEHTRINELNAIFDDIIRMTPLFSEDPNFSDTVFTENGGRAYHQTALESVAIDFDSATGIFRNLLNEFGPYELQTRCLVKASPDPFVGSYNLMPLILTFTTP